MTEMRWWRRIEFGDSMMFLYIAVIVRQYLWWSGVSSAICWGMAFAIGAGGTWFYIRTREFPTAAVGVPFWLVVGLPLTFVYALRVVIPDTSFDVLNYRLLHGERALHGFPFMAGDFFPTPAPYNPAPDMVTGIWRHILGYRLGTLPNLLAMFWSGMLVDQFFRAIITNAWRRSAAVLLVLCAEHLLFEINNYMVDLLAVPLLLAATRLALRNSDTKNLPLHMARIAALLGLAVAFKLVNVAVVAPFVLLCVYDFIRHRPTASQLFKTVAYSAAGFLFSVLPFSVYMQQQTGSALFPIYNGIFKSPYWGAHSGWDERWGPHGALETLLWPFQMTLVPARLSELSVYSGRMSMATIVALLALFVARRDKSLRVLSFIIIASVVLWSVAIGYIRYALHLELLGGILIVLVAAALGRNGALIADRLRTALVGLLWVSLGAQAFLAARYVKKFEWSQRPTVFRDAYTWKENARETLRDRDLRTFLSPADQKRFHDVDVWIEAGTKASGLQVLLNGSAPFIGLRNGENFATREANERFASVLEQAAGKRVFTLCFADDLETALGHLTSKGLAPAAQTQLMLPFYSHASQLAVVLIEVTGVERAAELARAASGGANL